MVFIRKVWAYNTVAQPPTPTPIVIPNKASNTSFKFARFPKDSLKGLEEVLPSAFALANNGDSRIFFRIHMEIPSITTDAKNGIRHPQDSQAEALITIFVTMITPIDTANPRAAVICIQEVQKPLLVCGACSATKVAAPPYSPPMARPCSSRNRRMITGAQKPI